MKKITILLWVLLLTLFLVAEEEFESFDDEVTSFVIKTKKPKIIVNKDSTQESNAVQFEKASVGKNKAISLSVKNFLIFSKLKEINARYLVLNLELNNILTSQKVIVSNGSNHPSSWVNKSADEYEYKEAIPLYQIPNIKQHLYLRVNNQEEKRIDEISLLLDKPLLPFNTNQIEVLPQQLKEGQLAFRLPKHQKIKQLSLHYYDSKYGNINLPIIGEMKQKTVEVHTLSKTKSEKMNENFSLSVTGYETQAKIGANKASKGGQFEIIEIDIESKLYALLAFNPSERFYLTIGNTHHVKLHPITQALPMGLYNDASLSPGSNNKFRLAFYTPKGMDKFSRSLRVELQGKDIVIPIQKGEEDSAKNFLTKNTIEGTSLTINNVYTYNKKTLIDVSFEDKDDAYATRLHKAFQLNGTPLKKSDTLFGFKNKEVILNNTTKRVLLWFDIAFNDKTPLQLTSTIFDALKLTINKQPKILPDNLHYFLTKEYVYKHKQDAVDKKVLAMVKSFKAKKSKEANANTAKQKQPIATLESIKEKSKFINIPTMSASAYGEEKVAKLKTVDDLIEALKTLEWVPSAYEATTAIYSTPAIFTQGWSSENEMFKAIYQQVKHKNVKFGSYALNTKGKKELKHLAKNIPINKNLPFIEWEEAGKKRSLVLPFLKPINEVEKYVEKKKYLKSIKEKQATIEMKLTYTPKNDGSSTSGFGMFGGALGGATTTEKSDIIFKKSWNLDTISNTPVDVFFPDTTAFYTDNNETHQDTAHALKAKKVEPKVLTVNITMPDGKLDTYEHHFQKKQELKDVFFTFALATPDMSKIATEFLEKQGKLLFKDKNTSKISPMSTIKWMNRTQIYKFVSIQTKYEKMLNQKLHTQAKRNKRARVMMSMIEKNHKNQLISSLDLRRVSSDVYGEANATNSFRIMSGFMATEAEGVAALNNQNTISAFTIMKENQLLFVPNQKEFKEEFMHEMKAKKLPKSITDRLMLSNKIWIFPTKPIKKRWGWIEMNPKTYEITTVLDNNQYGMVDYSATVTSHQAIYYFVGLTAGVSVSILTVQVYKISLPEQDYQKMMKEAEEMAKRIGCGVSLVGGVVSKNGWGKKIFDSSITIAGCAGVNGDFMRAVGSLNGKGKLSLQNALNIGFAQGFSDGIAYYFAYKNK